MSHECSGQPHTYMSSIGRPNSKQKPRNARMKGVILAGGEGTRLKPLTLVTNKHLLPVFDQPMIVHPLETLKSIGVNDVCIITGGEYIADFMRFLGSGSKHGVNFT